MIPDILDLFASGRPLPNPAGTPVPLPTPIDAPAPGRGLSPDQGGTPVPLPSPVEPPGVTSIGGSDGALPEGGRLQGATWDAQGVLRWRVDWNGDGLAGTWTVEAGGRPTDGPQPDLRDGSDGAPMPHPTGEVTFVLASGLDDGATPWATVLPVGDLINAWII